MKGIMKRVTAIFMAVVMVVSCVMINGTKAEAGTYVVNPAEYDIRYLLSNYQISVKGALTTGGGGHQIGSLIVGGEASLGCSFGNGSIAPSYLNYVTKFSGTNGCELGDSTYKDCVNLNVYYTTSAVGPLNNSPNVFTQVDSYIDFDALKEYQQDKYHCEVVKKHMHAVTKTSIAIDYEI